MVKCERCKRYVSTSQKLDDVVLRVSPASRRWTWLCTECFQRLEAQFGSVTFWSN